MNFEEYYARHEELWSPAHLGQASYEWWDNPPHVRMINEYLVQTFHGKISRLMLNTPAQHAKSELVTKAFAAYALLNDPDRRVLVVGHERSFSETEYGLPIKDLVNRWGSELGIEIREDLRRKGEWKIEGRRGGVVCRGWQGGVTGRPADLFIIDDLIPTADKALSSVYLESIWRFYMNVVFPRVHRRTCALVVVGTRWSKNDLFGRILRQAARTGEKWTHLKFKAVAEKDDILGRPIGKALWPEEVSEERLRIAEKEFGRWFRAAYQQEPVDEQGNFFQPMHWPTYADVGGCYALEKAGGHRDLVRYDDVFVMLVVDWATSEKKKSDFTCVGAFGILADGRILALGMKCERVRIERCVELLAGECRKWRPALVVVEAGGFQTALAVECRRWSEIPEVRQVKCQGRTKLQRAQAAIVLGENGRIYLPDPAAWQAPKALTIPAGNPRPVGSGCLSFAEERQWLDDYQVQLAEFTGTDDSHDDMVDVTAYAAQQALILRGTGRVVSEQGMPCILTAGKDTSWMS